MLNLQTLTAEQLRSGALETMLPEVYALQGIVESNGWHASQDVFEHTVLVFEHLKGLLLLPELPLAAGQDLALREGRLQRRQLLLIAALTHDLGKSVSLVKSGQSTSFPAHEELSAGMLPGVAGSFGMDGKDLEYVTKLVRIHGTAHRLLGLVLAYPERKALYLDALRRGCAGAFHGMLLLCWADTLGSDLRRLNPTDFTGRERLFRSQLERRG